MAQTPKSKNEQWKPVVEDNGPSDYGQDIESGKPCSTAPEGSAIWSHDQGGTKGFAPQLAGKSIDDASNTSSFDARFDKGPPDYTLPGYPSAPETAKGKSSLKRGPTESIAGRVHEKE